MNRYAAIDVGTNSVLLLVAERSASGAWESVLERSEITRLGKGVDQTRRLSPEALELTLKTLESFAREAREAGARGIVTSATSAARDASNGADFIRGARDRAGLDVQIITGDEEARLSFASAFSDFGGDEALVVIDIGGGSTEFIFGDAQGQVTYRHSFDVGSVRLTERFVTSDPPSPQELAALEAQLATVLAPLPTPPTKFKLVGVAGTVTTIAAISRRVDPYDSSIIHGAELTRAEVEHTVARLASLPLELRRTVPGLQPKRADVIVAGALILRAALAKLSAQTLTVSDRGLRWGLLADRFGSAS